MDVNKNLLVKMTYRYSIFISFIVCLRQRGASKLHTKKHKPTRNTDRYDKTQTDRSKYRHLH